MKKIITVLFAIFILSACNQSEAPSSPTLNEKELEPVTEEMMEEKLVEEYSIEDVATHSTKEDCWTIINEGVYDITNAIDSHPNEGILKGCGKESTSLFEEKHNEGAKMKLEDYKIGELKK